MEVLAPAKINLSLLCDQIKIDKSDSGKGIEFHCDDPSVPTSDDNLVVRAANVFFAATKLKSAVSIELKKRIPHGAGLGGGSSDAASTLLALNELFETKLPREALAKLAEPIGSDVPFFIFESVAICRERGELVAPMRLPQVLSILLLKPDFVVPTGWAYSRWQDSVEIPGISYAPQEFASQTFMNDLERPVLEKFVFLAHLKMWLLNQPEVGTALMSGSGSTVFAVMRPHVDVDLVAERAKAELDAELWTCACETRSGSG